MICPRHVIYAPCLSSSPIDSEDFQLLLFLNTRIPPIFFSKPPSFTHKPGTNSHHLLPTNHINPQSLQGKTPTESNKKRKQQQLPPMAINLFWCPSRPFRMGGTCGCHSLSGPQDKMLKDPLCPMVESFHTCQLTTAKRTASTPSSPTLPVCRVGPGLILISVSRLSQPAYLGKSHWNMHFASHV